MNNWTVINTLDGKITYCCCAAQVEQLIVQTREAERDFIRIIKTQEVYTDFQFRDDFHAGVVA